MKSANKSTEHLNDPDEKNGLEVISLSHSPRASHQSTSFSVSDIEAKNNQTKVPAPSSVTHLELEEELEDGGKINFLALFIVRCRSKVHQAALRNKKRLKIFTLLVLVFIYNTILITAIGYSHHLHVNQRLDEKDGFNIDWCNGVGILIVISAVAYWSFFYYFIIKGFFGERIKRTIIQPCQSAFTPIFGKWYIPYAMKLICFAGAVTFIAVDAKGQPERLVSAGGYLVIILAGLLLSKYPGRVKWSQLFWGVGLQFIFGLIILRWENGRKIFDCISHKVKLFFDFTDTGSSFVYGYLATGVNVTSISGNYFWLPPTFAFKFLSVIFFFSFVINLLYHFGVMMWVIMKLGWFLQVTVGTTAAESMSAAANIFIGQTEAPILIRPFLNDMTNSELHAVMTGGFATIAGTAMGAYMGFGIEPAYLLSASIMAAPIALAISKLFYPETKVSRTTTDHIKSISFKSEGNALDAASQGASQGVMLIGNIIANVIAFMAFVSFLNAIIQWMASLVGLSMNFETILGKIFVPVAYLIGIDREEVEDVALLLGLKTVVNEFVAYGRLITQFKCLSARSTAIATYGLCSFANFASIGVQLGGISFMAPNRRTDLAKTIWSAFIAANFCGLLNACMAGMLISAQGFNEDHYNLCKIKHNL